MIYITAPSIFRTAYDEYVLKAFQLNGIVCLLKPFLSSDLRGGLEKLATLKNIQQEDSANKRQSFQEPAGYLMPIKQRSIVSCVRCKEALHL